MNNLLWNTIYTAVINLPKETGRKSHMESELTKLGIHHIFLEATDGYTYDFSQLYDEKVVLEKHGRPLGKAEKGCALSHIRALGAFLESGKTYGLILEDDIVLDQAFTQAIETCINEKKS